MSMTRLITIYSFGTKQKYLFFSILLSRRDRKASIAYNKFTRLTINSRDFLVKNIYQFLSLFRARNDASSRTVEEWLARATRGLARVRALAFTAFMLVHDRPVGVHGVFPICMRARRDELTKYLRYVFVIRPYAQ